MSAQLCKLFIIRLINYIIISVSTIFVFFVIFVSDHNFNRTKHCGWLSQTIIDLPPE